MNEFLENLKREAEANPTLALAALGGLFAGSAKLIEAIAHHKGSTAFAKDVERRIKVAKTK